jgi:uncharacterized membrane protein YjgN (DUF898 family)
MTNSISSFDGGLGSYVGVQLLAALITFITLGICYPWAVCRVLRWETEHSVIEGRRLKFTGTATGLFGHWIKWLLLSVITLGIYSFWVGIKMRQWKLEHTIFA